MLLFVVVEAEVRDWLEEHIDNWSTNKYLIAVSGGVDSVVLCRIFKQLGLEFQVAHCNFQLRDTESDEDAHFVQKLCEDLEVVCHIKNFETEQYAIDQKLSIQVAARNMRYAWFKSLREQLNLDFVAVGSHRNDETETILINLIRGSGISGTHGILPVNDHVIRPLLNVTREEIETLAKENGWAWREDSSNQSTYYLRNKLRHEVIPILKNLNPALENRVSQNAKQVRQAERVLDSELENISRLAMYRVKGYWEINKFIILAQKEPALFLHHSLSPYGFSINQCQDFIKNAVQQAGGVVSSSSYDLLNDRNFWVLSPKKEENRSTALIDKHTAELKEWNLHFEVIDSKTLIRNQDSAICDLDFDLLDFPLELRQWQAGDKFTPLGMKGRKKVSDFLVDQKVPKTLKSDVCVLLSAGQIVCLPGMRVADPYKLTSKTKKIFRVWRQ